MPGQIGLFVLSSILAFITFYGCWRLTKQHIWPVRLLIAVVLFFAFEWLSPQIYYTYYIFLLDVPWQIVIQAPPTPIGLIKLLGFSENANLSYHSRGVLGWVLIFCSLGSAPVG